MGYQLYNREDRVAVFPSFDDGFFPRLCCGACDDSFLFGCEAATVGGICQNRERGGPRIYWARCVDVSLFGVFRSEREPVLLHAGLALHVSEPFGNYCGDGANLRAGSRCDTEAGTGYMAQGRGDGHLVCGDCSAGFGAWDIGAFGFAARGCDHHDGFSGIRDVCGAGEARGRGV